MILLFYLLECCFGRDIEDGIVMYPGPGAGLQIEYIQLRDGTKFTRSRSVGNDQWCIDSGCNEPLPLLLE
jgi:hypothetical protein